VDAHDYPIAHFQGIERLALAFKALPAQVLEHQYFYESFGSWHLLVRHGGTVSQLSYDGRDHQLFLRRSPDRRPPYSFGSEQLVGIGLGDLEAPAIQGICDALTMDDCSANA